MGDPIETAAFLSNSENRVRVLEALASGSKTRRALAKTVDVSRVTLGRILGELEDRQWIARTGEEYRLTVLGEFVVEEYTDLLAAMETERQLRDVVEHLPTREMDFDVGRLAGGEIVRPTRNNPAAHVDRIAAEIGDADRVRAVAFSVVMPALAAAREATVERGATFEAVFAPGVYDVMLDDPGMRSRFLDMFPVEDTAYHACEEDLPALFVIDGSVVFLLTDDGGTSQGLLVTGDPAVREWAVETFETYREAADTVDREWLGV